MKKKFSFLMDGLIVITKKTAITNNPASIMTTDWRVFNIIRSDIFSAARLISLMSTEESLNFVSVLFPISIRISATFASRMNDSSLFPARAVPMTDCCSE